MCQRINEKGLNIFVDSAGIAGYHQGELADPRMRQAASCCGYTITHHSRKVAPSDFQTFDMIVAMDDSNYDDLMSLAATIEEEQKIVKINKFFKDSTYDYIPDPYYGGSNGFALVIRLLEQAIDNIIEEIKIRQWR